MTSSTTRTFRSGFARLTSHVQVLVHRRAAFGRLFWRSPQPLFRVALSIESS
jgi:hypothetical protein